MIHNDWIQLLQLPRNKYKKSRTDNYIGFHEINFLVIIHSRNSFSDISRKCMIVVPIHFLLISENKFTHEIKCNGFTSFMEFMTYGFWVVEMEVNTNSSCSFIFARGFLNLVNHLRPPGNAWLYKPEAGRDNRLYLCNKIA